MCEKLKDFTHLSCRVTSSKLRIGTTDTCVWSRFSIKDLSKMRSAFQFIIVLMKIEDWSINSSASSMGPAKGGVRKAARSYIGRFVSIGLRCAVCGLDRRFLLCRSCCAVVTVAFFALGVCAMRWFFDGSGSGKRYSEVRVDKIAAFNWAAEINGVDDVNFEFGFDFSVDDDDSDDDGICVAGGCVRFSSFASAWTYFDQLN